MDEEVQMIDGMTYYTGLQKRAAKARFEINFKDLRMRTASPMSERGG